MRLDNYFLKNVKFKHRAFHQCKLPCIVPISATGKYYTKHTNYDFLKN